VLLSAAHRLISLKPVSGQSIDVDSSVATSAFIDIYPTDADSAIEKMGWTSVLNLSRQFKVISALPVNK